MSSTYLVQNATANAATISFRDYNDGAPSVDILITGTATVTIYQGNDNTNLHSVLSTATSGAFIGAGNFEYLGYEITGYSSGNVSVSISDKQRG